MADVLAESTPAHAANIRRLARQGYFDGLAIIRSQDNFVVQWGDPDSKRPPGEARATLPPEFTVPLTAGLPFTRLPDSLLRRSIRLRTATTADCSRVLREAI